MLISPKTNSKNAYIQAEKLRNLIENFSFPCTGSLTASFGVAEYQKGSTSIKDLIAKADQALYRAKKEGRNRVVQAKS